MYLSAYWHFPFVTAALRGSSLSIVQYTTTCVHATTCNFQVEPLFVHSPAHYHLYKLYMRVSTHWGGSLVHGAFHYVNTYTQHFNEQLYVSASRTLPHVQASLIPICLRPGFEPATSRTIVECLTNCAIWTAMVVTAEFDYSFFKFISRPPNAKNLVSNKLIRVKFPPWRQRRASARTSASLSLHGGKFNLYQLVWCQMLVFYFPTDVVTFQPYFPPVLSPSEESVLCFPAKKTPNR